MRNDDLFRYPGPMPRLQRMAMPRMLCARVSVLSRDGGVMTTPAMAPFMLVGVAGAVYCDCIKCGSQCQKRGSVWMPRLSTVYCLECAESH